jgi:hypothetical protein
LRIFLPSGNPPFKFKGNQFFRILHFHCFFSSFSSYRHLVSNFLRSFLKGNFEYLYRRIFLYACKIFRLGHREM